MLINELPAEILLQILSNVPKKDNTRECMNVCRLWRRKLAPVVYQDIIINKNHGYFLQYTQKRIFDNGDRIGDFVKTLAFGEETENHILLLSRKNFKLLIDSLPSLQAIRFDRLGTNKTVKYMEFLDKITKHTKLQEVSITGWVPAYADFVRTCHLYYSFNSRIKHQITTLVIVNTSVKFQNNQKMFEYFKGFVNLKHLTLYNLESQPRFREDIDVTLVLDACDDNLKSLTLDNSSLSYMTGDHKYHYNLTSLTMELPILLTDHFDYLVEYVPNLKELDFVISGDGQMIETIYDSLDPDMAYRFTRYIKQLQSFRFYSGVDGVSPSMNVFWQTMEAIYNGQNISNLVISFGELIHQYETIYFDKKTFNVDCDFQIDDFSGIARGFQFLHLNSISVHFSVRWIRQLGGTRNIPTMSDLLDFAVLQQHVQANFVMDEQQIILCKKTNYVSSVKSWTRFSRRLVSRSVRISCRGVSN